MTVSPDLSVIIPTFNSAGKLGIVLNALTDCLASSTSFEVIVVDDGSTDGPAGVIDALALPQTWSYICQPNRGAAAARNHGAALAKGDRLLFLDSDVVPDPAILTSHIACQSVNVRSLIVGRTRSCPGIQDSVFYRLMAEDVFAFDLGDHEIEVGYQEVVSRNLSMLRNSFLEIGGFDETFPRSGYEDTEFAYRAQKLGYRFIYCPAASGVHCHAGTLGQVGEHMYSYQVAAALFICMYPETADQIRHLLDKQPISIRHDPPVLLARKLARRALSLRACQIILHRIITLMEKCDAEPFLLRKMYWQVLGDYLFRGYREGLRRYESH